MPSELPGNGGVSSVAIGLPSSDGALECLFGRDAPPQALPLENTHLNLRHVKPTGMFRREVKLELAQDPLRCFSRKRLEEGACSVRIQVVQDDVDTTCPAIGSFSEERLHNLCKVFPSSSPAHGRKTPPGTRLHSDENGSGSTPTVLVIVPGGVSRLDRKGGAAVNQELF